MQRILRISSLVMLSMVLTALNTMDFYPPSLRKELKPTDKITVRLNEMQLSDEVRSQVPMGKFYSVADSTSKRIVYIGRVNACRAGGCMDPIETGTLDETYEYFDYFIVFDSTRAVQNVHIFNYQATHGQEITSKNWLKQFRHFNGNEDLVVGKNIDGISGATVSVEALVYDVKQKTDLLQEIAAK